jgi:hypothetical protein
MTPPIWKRRNLDCRPLLTYAIDPTTRGLLRHRPDRMKPEKPDTSPRAIGSETPWAADPTRTGAERRFATAKDPATNDISRGWCRLMGLAPLMLFTTSLLVVHNQRILHAWNARQEQKARACRASLKPPNAAPKHSPASPCRCKPAPAAHELPHERPYLV